MKTISESEKISLTECKRILNKDGTKYSDEEILLIRNWLYHVANFTLAFTESKSKDEISQMMNDLEIWKQKSKD